MSFPTLPYLSSPLWKLQPGSFQVKLKNPPLFSSWNTNDHAVSYSLFQRVIDGWKQSRAAEQHLLYGKVCDTEPFYWEIVPIKTCNFFFTRIFQQIQILWRTVFGGIKDNNYFQHWREASSFMKRNLPLAKNREPSQNTPGEDPFCKKEVIERQWVLQGEKVHALLSHAPIGFGGERLHFLVLPKRHAEGLQDLSQEEYVECMSLTKTLVEHFQSTRKNIKNIYLLAKTGRDAGQTVNHWHLHVIVSATKTQDVWGRLTVFKNILFGSSPMKKQAFNQKVTLLRSELNHAMCDFFQ